MSFRLTHQCKLALPTSAMSPSHQCQLTLPTSVILPTLQCHFHKCHFALPISVITPYPLVSFRLTHQCHFALPLSVISPYPSLSFRLTHQCHFVLPTSFIWPYPSVSFRQLRTKTHYVVHIEYVLPGRSFRCKRKSRECLGFRFRFLLLDADCYYEFFPPL